MSAENASWSWSPSRSIRASSCNCSASACPTLFTIASSAARWRVSSNSRAFSSATLRLPARVVSSPTSLSLKACSRSRFCSEMTPVACPPTTSGTKTADFGASPWSTRGCPTSADRSVSRSFTTTVVLVSTACLRKPMSSIGSSGKRTPRSIVYGKWITPASRSRIPMSTTCASKISCSRSPTRSYIACASSFSASPRCTALISASSALRCRVSSNSRAFSSATLRLPARVVSSRTSLSLNAPARGRGSAARSRRSPARRRRAGAKTDDFGASPWIDRRLPGLGGPLHEPLVHHDRRRASRRPACGSR